jgi:hypothetical protein
MQFLLFDVSATLVFLVGYLAVVALQRRRTLAVVAAMSRAPRGALLPAAPRERPKPRAAQSERPTEPCCREWPRLSAPR